MYARFRRKDMSKYYLRCSFNYGVSIDHLIVPRWDEQKERRWEITFDNAKKCMKSVSARKR